VTEAKLTDVCYNGETETVWHAGASWPLFLSRRLPVSHRRTLPESHPFPPKPATRTQILLLFASHTGEGLPCPRS